MAAGYIGVHYLSDVLAGWVAGGTSLAFCITTLLMLEHRAHWSHSGNEVSAV